MNSNKSQLRQPSRSTRPAPLATAAGHPNQPREPAQTDGVDPLHTLINPSMAHAQPYLYSSHISHLLPTLPSPNLPSTPPFASAIPSSSLPLPCAGTRSIPSKRTRGYNTNPQTLYPSSPVPSSLSINYAAQPSSERPAKRPRLDMGRPSTITNRRGLQVSAPSKPSPLSQPPMVGPTPPRPRPKPRKAPLHQNRIPLAPYPEPQDSKRLLEEELKGPVDPAVAKDLGDLAWRQQKRVWNDVGGYSDPFLRPIDISLLNARSSSSYGGVTPVQSRQEVIALYGPLPRNNESTRLGDSLTNPNAIVPDDDGDDGFETVLDLYCGAVQGSTLSMELELVVGGDVELIGTSWEAASSLEVSVTRQPSAPTSSGDLRESRICTLEEYRQVIEAEKAESPKELTIAEEEPPLGIVWSYSCCGYAVGRVVNVHSANTTSGTDAHGSNREMR